MFLPHPRVKVSIVGSLRDREVACSASDRQGSSLESCVWRTVSSQSSHHPQEVLLAQFSLYVHKGGLKPDSFHYNCGSLLNLGSCDNVANVPKNPFIIYSRNYYFGHASPKLNLVFISRLTGKRPTQSIDMFTYYGHTRKPRIKYIFWPHCVALILNSLRTTQSRDIHPMLFYCLFARLRGWCRVYF